MHDKYAPPALDMALQPSRLACCVVLLIHLLAAASLSFWSIYLLPLLLVSCAYLMQRERVGYFSHVLWRSDMSIRLTTRQGQFFEAHHLGHYRSRYLVVIHCKTLQGKRHVLVVYRDAVNGEVFRKLLVRTAIMPAAKIPIGR